ncbi:MAG TPA: hypothetical protein DIT64_15945 [Verrucomicrobiales bacterium]|nr:hypothetical protein [Verrucomicrobiales bacterium]
MKSPLDVYSLKARLFPAFIVLLPAVLAILAWLPEASLASTSTLGVGLAAALSFFISELVRDCGHRKQARLWETWGGPPTTQLLRWSNLHVNPNLRAKWRAAIEELTNCRLPSAASESRNPFKADQAYEAAIAELRMKRRGTESSSLFFKENASYGFRRNLWGMKPAGIFISSVSLIGGVVVCVLKSNNRFDHAPSILAIFVTATLLALWIVRINPQWVREKADSYGEQLLGSLLQ